MKCIILQNCLNLNTDFQTYSIDKLFSLCYSTFHMKSPEELRNHWKTLDYPRAFDPDQPNWTDLTVEEVAKDMRSLGTGNYYALLKRTTFENVHRRMILSSTHPGMTYNIPQVMDEFEGSLHLRAAMPFSDPDDMVYFDDLSTIVRLSPAATLISDSWQVYWQMRVDTAVNLTNEGLTENQAKILITPQSVTGQHRPANELAISMVNRQYLYRTSNNLARASIVEGGYLFYFQLLTVERGGHYPFFDEEKKPIIDGIVAVLNKVVGYAKSYRENLLDLFKTYSYNQSHFPDSFARERVIPFPDIFAAQED